MSDAANNPSTQSAAREGMEYIFQIIAALRGGTAAMREAGEEYLPALINESGEQWEARLSSTTLLNVLEDSIDNCVDRIFSEQWRVEETAPPEVQDWAEDIDLKGNGTHEFAKLCLDAAMGDGLVHVLVDYPTLPRMDLDGNPATPAERPRLTLKEERALNLRPYLVMIKASDVVAAYEERLGGETVVTHVRFKENVVVRDGFSEKEVERIRVLEPGRWEVWEKAEGAEAADFGGWAKVDEGETLVAGYPLDRVLFFTLYTGKVEAPFKVKPPFLDLAYLNIRHWQSTSLQQNILDRSRYPMLAVSGFEGTLSFPHGDEDFDGHTDTHDQPPTVGPGAILTTGKSDGKWYYVEPQGASIKLGAEDLKALEEQMRVTGIEPLMPANRSQTATEDSTDEAKARAPLEVWARDLAKVLTRALKWACLWAGVDHTNANIHANTEVGVGFSTAQDMQTLIQMKSMGMISGWTFYQEAVRRGFFGPNFDINLETKRIALEAPPPDPNALPAPTAPA